jgi:exodeoxyribonuclease V alpha subunit
LSPVEAGAVLADVVRAEDTAPGEPELAQALTELGPDPGSRAAPRRVVTLDHVYRFGDGGAIDTLAKAVRSADPAAVLDALRTAGPEVEFVEVDPGVPGMAVGRLADQVRDAGRRRIVAAEAGDVVGALAAIEVHRLLCAHRRGPYGVSRWSDEAERWLELDTDRATGRGTDGEWYLGRPVLVTANDYELGLYNGDIGVVVATPTGPRVAFARGSGHTLIAPVRLDSVQTVHAMTVHRAQGSQFDGVSFIVPPADSPLLTRELLYTAVTRASRRVQVFGTADAIERAVLRPANRASGLADRL